MLSACVVSVQKYCVHDGNGIRTTIFFKGCPLSCQWCHNPESQHFRPQLMFYPERCRGCGACAEVCPEKCIFMESGKSGTYREKCSACGLCADVCPYGAREIAGTMRSIDELVKSAEQDKMFYEASGGGITLSGGEATQQDKAFLLELLRRLKQKGCNIVVDTCGFAPYEVFESIMPYVDSFLYDIKLMDPIKHKQYTGQSNELILSNLKRLSDAGAHLHIRIPVIDGINSTDHEIDRMISFIRENLHVEKISLLPYHTTGRDKRRYLEAKDAETDFKTPDDRRLAEIVEKFRLAGFADIGIGG